MRNTRRKKYELFLYQKNEENQTLREEKSCVCEENLLFLI